MRRDERPARAAWTRPLIVARLRARRQRGRSLAYRAAAAADRALVAAAAYHFGSYRRAVEAAGFDYDRLALRPRWTKERIIRAIKDARRARRDLCWAAVTRRPGPLRCAAFAAVRLFGSWPRALGAGGVDVDDFRRYRAWDRTSVALDLRQRHADGDPMNSAAVQSADPGLYAAAIRYFGTFDKALKAARLVPADLRLRRRAAATKPWTDS